MKFHVPPLYMNGNVRQGHSYALVPLWPLLWEITTLKIIGKSHFQINLSLFTRNYNTALRLCIYIKWLFSSNTIVVIDKSVHFEAIKYSGLYLLVTELIIRPQSFMARAVKLGTCAFGTVFCQWICNSIMSKQTLEIATEHQSQLLCTAYTYVLVTRV